MGRKRSAFLQSGSAMAEIVMSLRVGRPDTALRRRRTLYYTVLVGTKPGQAKPEFGRYYKPSLGGVSI